MNPCGWLSLNLSACAGNMVSGWLVLLPWWGWAALGLVLSGIVYRLAGWLGLLGLTGALGYWLGRRGPDPFDPPGPSAGADRLGPLQRRRLPAAKKPVRTIFDILSGK